MESNKSMPKGFGFRGWMLMVYQMLAYIGYVAYTSYPVNVLSEYVGGTTVTTLLTMIGSFLCFFITYLIVAPRIGKIRNQKALSLLFGVISLVIGALIMLIPPDTMKIPWMIVFVVGLLIFPIWANTMTTILIGNWFPRKKGTVMGIVTLTYPLASAILLSLFKGRHAGIIAAGGSLVKANLISWAPFYAACILGLIICAIFIKTYPEQCGCYRDNDKSFTAEKANAMLMQELENRKKSCWKRSKIWGCAQWWFCSVPTTLILTCSIAFMVQIVPALISFNQQLSIFAIPGFSLMSLGFTSVLFMMGIAAMIGSWLLGILDTKYGTKTAIFVTSIIMLICGVLGAIDNVWTLFAATMLLGIFMGAGSNFAFSALVRYWRPEDFPAVYTGAPPFNTVVNAVFPFIFAAIATTPLGYHATFIFVACMAVLAIILNRLFDPKKLADYDAKLRKEAGLPLDDVLYDRVGMEKRMNQAKKGGTTN